MTRHASTALQLLPELPPIRVPAPMGLYALRRGVYRSQDRRFLVVGHAARPWDGLLRGSPWQAYAVDVESMSLKAETLRAMRQLLGSIITVPLVCGCCGLQQIWQHHGRAIEITCGCRSEAMVPWDPQRARQSRLTCGTMRCHHCGLEIPFSHRYFGQDAAGHLWAYHVNAMSQEDIGPDRCLKPAFWQAHFSRQGHGLMLQSRLTMTRNLEGGGEGTIVL